MAKKLLAMVLGLTMMIGVAGCSAVDTGSGSNDKNADTQVSVSAELLDAAKYKSDKEPADWTIAVVVKDGTSDWFKRMQVGVDEFGKEKTVDVIQKGPANADAASQVQLVEDMINQGVDALCIVPIDPGALESVLKKAMETLIGGALYSCWPIDFSKPVDKKGDWERGIEGMAKLGRIAAECGIEVLGLESLNRFENHVINTSKECTAFVKSVRELEPKASNVSVMLDTFHMNIEEESIGAAIREAGSLLGHFHTGECNRMVPGRGRTPWREIGEALRDINYDKTVVMEPFVMPGGTVGQNIKVWRDIVPDTSEEALDRDAKKALEFERYMLG